MIGAAIGHLREREAWEVPGANDGTIERSPWGGHDPPSNACNFLQILDFPLYKRRPIPVHSTLGYGP